MKNYYLVLTALLFFSLQLSAQTPNKLNYQGVARNASGLVVPNQLIGLQFIIHQGTPTGTVVYQETQTTTTNLLGLFTVAIGSGAVVTGPFSAIAWGSNAEYLEVDMDVTGGTSYVTMGTNQFLSVPYALNSGTSNTSWNVTGNTNTTGSNYIGTTDANDVIFKTNGTNEIMRASNANGNVGIGTTAPNAGAALDVSSTNKGMLIPRLAANPANPVAGMMYYNTNTGCFMFYSGTAWDAMVCPCANPSGVSNIPATPASISQQGGATSFCPSTSNVVFSTPVISNATSYTWVITTTTGGAAINLGQGTNVITMTTGTVATTLKVTANNNCGSSGQFTSGSFTVTAGPAITTQPLTQSVNTGTNVNFSVVPTVPANVVSYQWQVSTNGGTSYANVVNNATYSNVTTATMTITGAPIGLNGNLYRVALAGTCTTLNSSGATLTVCPGAVSSAGPISGITSVCAGTAGVVYSVAPVTNATTYAWTVPIGTIVGAATNNLITVNVTTTSGTVSVIPSNGCGSGASASQLVSVNPTTAITIQPTNTTAGSSFANFSVGAVGGGLTYQWMVSTTGLGGTYATITNNATYSGATTSTLSIANPTVGMTSYAFEVVVNGTCGGSAITSNQVQITSICTSPASPSVPITIHNTAGSATSANLAVLISPLNFSTFSGNEDANLDNIEFSVGGSLTNGGTALYAWIESGSSISSGTATTPTSASTAGIVWVNLGSTTIPAGATITIYLNFMSSPVITGTTSRTGIAPELTTSTVGYGAWDNGALVFPTFYDNFAGNTLSAKWANNYHSTNGVIGVNNGLSLSVPATGNEAAVISSATSFAPPYVAESYVNSPIAAIGGFRSYMPGLISTTAAAEGALEGANITDNYPSAPYTSYVCFSDGRAFGAYSWLQGATTSPSPYGDYDIYSTTPTGYNVFGLYYNPTANSLYKNYTFACNGTATYSPAANTSMYFALGQSEGQTTGGVPASLMSYWARIRVYPPAGTAPTVTVGSFGCN